MEEEFGEMCPQTQEFCNQHRPEAGQGKEDSPLEPQGSMAPTLTGDFRSLEQWEANCCCVKPPSLCSFVTAVTRH